MAVSEFCSPSVAHESHTGHEMSLLKSGLFRFFTVGFALGALAVFATFGIGPDRVSPSDVVPAAVAAPVQ